MKQLITIFRVEGPQAARVAELFDSTAKEDIFLLRDAFRDQALATSRLTAYFEFLDAWSMRDNLLRALGSTALMREASSGEMYSLSVTGDLRSSVLSEAQKQHQFVEQDRLAKCIADMATTPQISGAAVMLTVFREILGVSTTDEEIKEGANQALHGTARRRP